MKNPKLTYLIFDARAFLTKLKHLKYTVDTDPYSVGSSICGMVRPTQYTQHRLGISWSNWPEYSGQMNYPVCTGNYKLWSENGPHRQFIKTKYFFNPKSEYGRARTRLLYWLIEQVENRIKELESQNA